MSAGRNISESRPVEEISKSQSGTRILQGIAGAARVTTSQVNLRGADLYHCTADYCKRECHIRLIRRSTDGAVQRRRSEEEEEEAEATLYTGPCGLSPRMSCELIGCTHKEHSD